MYYTISSSTPQEVRLDLTSKYINIGKHVFAFVFDNSKGAVKLIQDASEQSVAWIPYEQIDYFNIITKTSSGSTGNRYYEVIMHLKSLASWPLFQFGYLDKAEAALNNLKTSIDLDKRSSFIDNPKFPSDIITVTHTGDKTVLRWRNSSKVSDAVKLGVIGFAAGALILYLMKITLSESWFGFLVIVVFFVIYVIILYGKITTLMKDHVTGYGFSFGTGEMEYFEDSISSGRRKFSSVIPQSSWAGLSYPNSTAGQDVILSINNDSYQKLKQLAKNKASVRELYQAGKETQRSQQLRIKDLHPVERVNAVNWMMEEINKGR